MGAVKKALLAAAALAGLGLAAVKATGQQQPAPARKKPAPAKKKRATKAATKPAKKAVRRSPAKGGRKKSPRAA
jgi:hypothetical protein